MKFKVTPDELAKQKLVTAGWLPVEIIKVTEGLDKGKTGAPAGLMTVEGRVIGGKEEDRGAVLRCWFSEKAQGTIANFAAAVTGRPFEANKDYDFSEKNLKGKRMEWYVERGTFNGKPTNNVLDHRPLQSGDVASSSAAVAGAPAGPSGGMAQNP